MNNKLLYYETLSVQWVSEGLNQFFRNIGYNFFSNTVQEIKEALVPLDRIYAAKKGNRILLFALQFKSPMKRDDIICWKISPDQHKMLTKEYFSKFIWYCLPFMKEIGSWKNILYHTLFINPKICTHELRWFIWDDYYLYFYPGGGGCKRFLEQLRYLPCGPVPIKSIDEKLKKAVNSNWNFAINYDSWGTLYYKLLSGELGFMIENDSDYTKVKKHISGQDFGPLKDEAIIIVIDIVNQTVDTINIVSSPKSYEDLDNSDDIFPYKMID